MCPYPNLHFMTYKHPEIEQGLCCIMPRRREEFKVMHKFCILLEAAEDDI